MSVQSTFSDNAPVRSAPAMDIARSQYMRSVRYKNPQRRTVHVQFTLYVRAPMHNARVVYVVTALTEALCTYIVDYYFTQHLHCNGSTKFA